MTDATSTGSESAGQPYLLTVKRGFLALVIMFASQAFVSWGYSLGAGTMDSQTIVMMSVLGGGVMALLWVWTDIRRFGPSFSAQIGLRPSVVNAKQAALLVTTLFVATHAFAWTYRSVILPLLGRGGVVGGGSQMFTHIRDSGSAYGMAGFIVLALVVGPVLEEFIFRGYLQSALARRMSKWSAIAITSLVFMVGHGPTILWPMYFVFSAAWGWVFVHTRSLKTAIAFHMLSNFFYTVVAVMGWKILA